MLKTCWMWKHSRIFLSKYFKCRLKWNVALYLTGTHWRIILYFFNWPNNCHATVYQLCCRYLHYIETPDVTKLIYNSNSFITLMNIHLDRLYLWMNAWSSSPLSLYVQLICKNEPVVCVGWWKVCGNIFYEHFTVLRENPTVAAK